MLFTASGVLALTVLLVAVVNYFAASDHSRPLKAILSRKTRQAFFQINSQVFSPLFFQNANNLPQPSTQFTDRCFALTGQFPPFGCSYVPNLFNPVNNAALSCRLDCSNIPIDQVAQPLQFLNFFQAPNTNYLTNGNYRITDQSNLDVFVGDSYYVFTPSTTTAATTTRTSTTTTRTSTTTPTTTRSTATTTRVTTTPTTTTARTTLSPTAFIALCIEKQCKPPAGTTYDGTGTASPLSCGFIAVCVELPFQSCASRPIPTTNIGQCLRFQGAPPPGCTYTGTGLLSPTLTCPTLCEVENCMKSTP